VAAPEGEIANEVSDDEIFDKGDSGAGALEFTMPARENDRESNVGAADGIAHCRAGIATDATNTAVQAESSNFGWRTRSVRRHN
jgi:hypothetical protein